MLSQLNRLPGPLKVVAWLNIVPAILALIGGVALLGEPDRTEAWTSIASGIVSLLIVVGIVKRSKFVRILVLVFSWLGVVFYGVAFVASLFTIGLLAIGALIPITIFVLTIWALRHPSSKQYFWIGLEEPPLLSRNLDWMGRPMENQADDGPNL